MGSQRAQPLIQTKDSCASALQSLRKRMIGVVEASSLTDVEKIAMTKELINADYSISRLINIVANSSQDEVFTKLAPRVAPHCIRLPSISHCLETFTCIYFVMSAILIACQTH